MTARELLLNNMSGGVQYGDEPGEFTETQWKELHGLVFDDERRLRTQWASYIMRAGDDVVRLGEAAGHILAIRPNGIEEREEPPLGLPPGADPGDWNVVQDGGSDLTFGGNPTPKVVAKVPVRDGVGGWQEALLLNTVEPDQDTAYAIIKDGGTITPIKFTERYPADPETDDAMPYANVGTMWGSFLVLGDIRWAADPENTISEANSSRYPYSIWFSQPTSVTNWDPIDVEHMATHTGDGAVVGLFPLDIGLLVLSQDAVHLMRGTPSPNGYSYETVRADVGCPNPEAAAYWPHAGIVVWLDRQGFVWQTNGEEVKRLDLPLPPPEGPERGVTAWHDKLIIRRGTHTWVLHNFGRSAAWTSLRDAPMVSEGMASRDAFYWVHESNNTLHRFDIRAPRDVLASSTVITRPLGEAHRRTFWHRAGVRHRGPGEATVITWIVNRGESRYSVGLDRIGVNPGAAGAIPASLPWGFGIEVPETVTLEALRGGGVVPAPGPSQEALIRVDFQGDIILESVSVWFHEARAER